MTTDGQLKRRHRAAQLKLRPDAVPKVFAWSRSLTKRKPPAERCALPEKHRRHDPCKRAEMSTRSGEKAGEACAADESEKDVRIDNERTFLSFFRPLFSL